MTPSRKATLSALTGFILMSLGGFLLLTSSRVPYNVRELVAPGHKALGIGLLVLALYGTFGTPAYLARWLTDGRSKRSLLFPLVALANALLVWLSLRTAVPLEAIHDIVGSPILRWPWEWELLGRFVSLFLAPCTLFTGAVIAWSFLSGSAVQGSKGLLRWVLPAAVLLAVSYWVVIPRAATDNLTELMRGGGGPVSALALGGCLFLLGLGGAALSRLAAGQGRRALLGIVAVLGSVPLSYCFFLLGTEPAVHKYGRVFSAAQFLLSPDREHLAEGSALLLRYGLAAAGALCVIAITQHPFWLAGPGQPGKAGGRVPIRDPFRHAATSREMRGRLTAGALLLYAAVFLYPFHLSLPLRMENRAERTAAGWRFRSPGLVRSRGPAAFDGGRFDFTLRMRSAGIEQYGPARIFTISKDATLSNLTLGQDGADLILRVRAPGTTRNGIPQRRVRDVFSDGAWHSVQITVADDRVDLFVDGVLRLRRSYEGPVTATWDRSYVMALGNEPNGRRAWLGEIEYGGPMERPPYYWTPANAPRWVPLRGAKVSDLLINFLGFVPLGLVLVRLGWSRPAALLLAAALSFSIELVQLGLVDRFASTTDVLLNTAGCLAGALLARRSARADKP